MKAGHSLKRKRRLAALDQLALALMLISYLHYFADISGRCIVWGMGATSPGSFPPDSYCQPIRVSEGIVLGEYTGQ